jgi:tetraprenyl-beta-curcumene synthase
MLRRQAVDSHRVKRNPEGAAAFAVLAPRANRRQVTRMLVAFQTMFDYVDTVSEEPGADDPLADARHLNRALDASVAADPSEHDFYALHAHEDDGGYLAAQVAACRSALALLPGWPAVAETARRFAALYGEAQGICHARESGWRPPASAQRTRTEAARHPELLWGEVLAAASSLQVHALIGAAGSALPERDVESIAVAYHPWVGALHILLHGLVDQAADEAGGQFNQLNHYRSKPEAAERLALIASRARELVLALPRGDGHAAILSDMAGYYLAPRQVWEPEDAEVSSSALRVLGPLTKPALLLHRTRREGPRAAMRPLRPS